MSWRQARHAAKRVAYRVLPNSAQVALDVRYYERRMRAGTLVDEPELSFLDRYVQPGDAAADIGANLGAYTVTLSRLVGPSGKVLAFEPIPRTFETLERLIPRLAPWPNIDAVHAAVADRSGTARIYLPLEGQLPNFYVASLFPIHQGKVREIEVELVTLDERRERLARRLSFVKIDVEGAELLVLHGAARTIDEDRPVILCEIGQTARDGDHGAADVEAWFADHGYRLHQLVDGRLEASSTAAPVTRSPNYFALPEA